VQLVDIRTEVENRGFDPTQYGSRITAFINDAQNLIARRCQYYNNEDTYAITTVTGTATYALPANFARIRELITTDVAQIVQPCGLRDIDGSTTATGRPYFYALDAANIHLYPTPDNIYPLELRYWAMPPALVDDTDVPNLPVDWHNMLWIYSVWMCYEADDDSNMGQYWETRFEKTLAEFEADAKFPSTDYPNRIESMWGEDRGLGTPNGWGLWGG
jgi:hypothetical protein